jgi:hypothetical protein
MRSLRSAMATPQVIGYLGVLGSEGFMSIPPIVGQKVQLFMDAYLAGRWGDEALADGGADAADG